MVNEGPPAFGNQYGDKLAVAAGEPHPHAPYDLVDDAGKVLGWHFSWRAILKEARRHPKTARFSVRQWYRRQGEVEARIIREWVIWREPGGQFRSKLVRDGEGGMS